MPLAHYFVYVANNISNTVSVIDTAINPKGVAVGPGGQHAYVTNTGANTVSVIETGSNTVVARSRWGISLKV